MTMYKKKKKDNILLLKKKLCTRLYNFLHEQQNTNRVIFSQKALETMQAVAKMQHIRQNRDLNDHCEKILSIDPEFAELAVKNSNKERRLDKNCPRTVQVDPITRALLANDILKQALSVFLQNNHVETKTLHMLHLEKNSLSRLLPSTSPETLYYKITMLQVRKFFFDTSVRPGSWFLLREEMFRKHGEPMVIVHPRVVSYEHLKGRKNNTKKSLQINSEEMLKKVVRNIYENVENDRQEKKKKNFQKELFLTHTFNVDSIIKKHISKGSKSKKNVEHAKLEIIRLCRSSQVDFPTALKEAFIQKTSKLLYHDNLSQAKHFRSLLRKAFAQS